MLDNQPLRAINVPALCKDVHEEGGAVQGGGVTTLKPFLFTLNYHYYHHLYHSRLSIPL